MVGTEDTDDIGGAGGDGDGGGGGGEERIESTSSARGCGMKSL